MQHVHRQATAAPRSAMSRALDCVVGPEWAAVAGGIATGHLEVGDAPHRPHSYAPCTAAACHCRRRCRRCHATMPHSSPSFQAALARPDLWREVTLLEKLLYKNANQHRGAQHFQRLQEVRWHGWTGWRGAAGSAWHVSCCLLVSACCCHASPPNPSALHSSSGAAHAAAAARHAAGSPCSRAARCTRGCQAAGDAAYWQCAHGLRVSRVHLLQPCC